VYVYVCVCVSVLLETLFYPSRCASLRHWVHIVRNGSKRRDSRGARRFKRRSARNRDVPSGRDSDFREEDWFYPVRVDARARYENPEGLGSCWTYNVGASLAYYHIRTFPRPGGKALRTLLRFSSLSLSVSSSPSVLGDPENNLSHASRNSKRSRTRSRTRS